MIKTFREIDKLEKNFEDLKSQKGSTSTQIYIKQLERLCHETLVVAKACRNKYEETDAKLDKALDKLLEAKGADC